MKLNGKKWLISWLAALAPVQGFGQEIIEHPQDETVCIGKGAVFVGQAVIPLSFGNIIWLINGTSISLLPSGKQNQIEITSQNMREIRHSTMTVNYNEAFNGVTIQYAFAGNTSSNDVYSRIAHLFYESNQQFSVTSPTSTIDNATAQFDWDAHDSNFTTEYFIGVYDGNNNQIVNKTTDATHISFDFPPRADDACQYLEFRVTANQCPDPESPFIQTEGATIVYTRPDVSPVTTEFDGNRTVLVNWPTDGDNLSWIVVTDLTNNETVIKLRGISPYSHTPVACGEYNLSFAVSPAECPDHPSFTHNTSISFTIPCEPETSGERSGSQTLSPSSLPVLAVAATLVKHFYQSRWLVR